MPVKPLSFKGDSKKPKKRKQRSYEEDDSGTPALDGAHPNRDPADDDSWTIPDQPSDLTGPTLIVLPTNPPTCLASDAHGNIFASQLENIVESYEETAEPHDVRQVWVASTVAGTGQISFKASHGGYLSCDSIGVLGARREARGMEEGFVVEAVETDEGRQRFRLRTMASKTADGDKGRRYLSTTAETSTNPSKADGEDSKKKLSVSIRGDGEADSSSTQVVLKMQARFKPRLQQHKETKAKEKVSRRELEQVVGRRLDDEEVKRLKRAKKNGTYYEEILDVRVKGKHDKFAS
jgi:protein FRG1